MTRGGAVAPEPFDLSEIGRSGDLFDDLAARRASDPPADDPAARFLAALVADVDAGAPPLPASPSRVACTCGKPGRPVVRAFVTFGAATLMLMSAGAAVAGGDAGHGHRADGPAVHRVDGAERSKGNVAVRALPTVRRAPAPVTGTGRKDPAASSPSSAHDRRHAVPVSRHRRAASFEEPGAGSQRPPSPRDGSPERPVTDGPSASLPSSPPAALDPPQSPPAGTPDGSAALAGSGLGERSAGAAGSARHAGRAQDGQADAHGAGDGPGQGPSTG